jgi:hypothetical protein
MTIQFPTDVSFLVLRASMSSELEMRDGIPYSINSLNLVLVAVTNTQIQLSSGEHLSEVELHFTVSNKWHTPVDLDRDLNLQDVGFLCCVTEPNGKIFVHGAAIWPEKQLPDYLLADGLVCNVQLTIGFFSTTSEPDSPYLWAVGRENILHISSIRFSAQQKEETKFPLTRE